MNSSQIRNQIREFQQQIVRLERKLYCCSLSADKEQELRDIIEILAVKCSEIGEKIYDQRNED